MSTQETDIVAGAAGVVLQFRIQERWQGEMRDVDLTVASSLAVSVRRPDNGQVRRDLPGTVAIGETAVMACTTDAATFPVAGDYQAQAFAYIGAAKYPSRIVTFRVHPSL